MTGKRTADNKSKPTFQLVEDDGIGLFDVFRVESYEEDGLYCMVVDMVPNDKVVVITLSVIEEPDDWFDYFNRIQQPRKDYDLCEVLSYDPVDKIAKVKVKLIPMLCQSEKKSKISYACAVFKPSFDHYGNFRITSTYYKSKRKPPKDKHKIFVEF